MSTSFDVITRSDRIPTVKELMNGLFSLPQFARTGIPMDEIEVKCLVADKQLETILPERSRICAAVRMCCCICTTHLFEHCLVFL